MNRHITRRDFGATLGSAFVSFALGTACRRRASEPGQPDGGRLLARPRANVVTSVSGQRLLGLDRRRDAILHLPPKPTMEPLPLLVLFHGAGQSGENVLRRLGSIPDEAGLAVLAPDSRDSSWDAIRGSFGPDVPFVNRSLELVFESVAIDPTRISVGGFSDGASYAISLGLIIGDLFRRVVAFSPGFVIDGTPHGTPGFFISHGTDDPILPISRCSRPIVAGLQKRGYDVTFREFHGGHEIPEEIARDAIRWAVGATADSKEGLIRQT